MDVKELTLNGYKYFDYNSDYCSGLFQKSKFDSEGNLKYHIDIYLWTFPTHSYFEVKTSLMLDSSKEFYINISFTCTKDHSVDFVEYLVDQAYISLNCDPVELKSKKVK